jgi:hypothetical protein
MPGLAEEPSVCCPLMFSRDLAFLVMNGLNKISYFYCQGRPIRSAPRYGVHWKSIVEVSSTQYGVRKIEVKRV